MSSLFQKKEKAHVSPVPVAASPAPQHQSQAVFVTLSKSQMTQADAPHVKKTALAITAICSDAEAQVSLDKAFNSINAWVFGSPVEVRFEAIIVHMLAVVADHGFETTNIQLMLSNHMMPILIDVQAAIRFCQASSAQTAGGRCQGRQTQ